MVTRFQIKSTIRLKLMCFNRCKVLQCHLFQTLLLELLCNKLYFRMVTLKTNLIFTILFKLRHIELLLIRWVITLTTLKPNTLPILVMSTLANILLLVWMLYQFKFVPIRINIKIGLSTVLILMSVLDKLVLISCKMILLEQLDSCLDFFLLSFQH